MSATRKPRGDAKLKTLPEERQQQIDDLLAGSTLKDVQASLAEDGLNVSLQALSEFWSWRQLRAQFSRKETLVNEAIEQLKESNPQLSEEALFSHGQTVFGLLALEEKDALAWKHIQDARTARMKLDLDLQRFQRETAELFLKWAADRRAQEIANAGGLGQSEKIEQLGQLMFGDDWSAADSTAKDAKK